MVVNVIVPKAHASLLGKDDRSLIAKLILFMRHALDHAIDLEHVQVVDSVLFLWARTFLKSAV